MRITIKKILTSLERLKLGDFFVRYLRSIKKLNINRQRVLNMNQRNLDYIYPNNARQYYSYADNKMHTKLLLVDKAIPMAETYQLYSHFFQLRNLQKDLAAYQNFVIKPASGSGGGGILVIQQRHEQGFLNISGQYYSLRDIHKHIADILFGIYAFGLNDQAIVEQKIEQHHDILKLSPKGLADVRIIMYQQRPIQAMIRLATVQSNGTANLHQGAIGVGIDLQHGISCSASFKGRAIDKHPDTGYGLIGQPIPHWQKTLTTACLLAQHVPLHYIGVDIAITQQGPCLLEINARPGIEIQNANACGLRQLLENTPQTFLKRTGKNYAAVS